MAASESGPLVFVSYSHRDAAWRDDVRTHIEAFRGHPSLRVWEDTAIEAGERWNPTIRETIARADVAVCLVSDSYLASEFCVEQEFPALLEQSQRRRFLILLLRVLPCAWEHFAPMSELQMLPREGLSLSELPDRGTGVIREVVERIARWAKKPSVRPAMVDLGRLPMTGGQLFGRERELELLDRAWTSPQTRIVGLIATGGVGKSELVNQWLKTMAEKDYGHAARVYGWSFYNQNATEPLSSPDQFMIEALACFGDPNPESGSAWDKGERLAELVAAEKTLLVLDGLEPLQSNLSTERGKLSDPAWATFIVKLGRLDWEGLCVITSREPLPDLARCPKGAAEVVDLEQLSLAAGRELVRASGVLGSDAALESAVQRFGNHALAVQLLGAYVGSGRDISRAATIADTNPAEPGGNFASPILSAFERELGECPEVQTLRLLGLFDHAAAPGPVSALRAAKIEGLSAALVDDATFRSSLERLREMKLVSPSRGASSAAASDESLDCHPLIAAHFAQRLRQHRPEGWVAGNRVLFEYFANSAEAQPATLRGLLPLYRAVAHGCAAGERGRAFNEVYWKRIQREDEFFATRVLGAWGVDLACLSGFFETPWSETLSDLEPADQTLVRNLVGTRLRACGRLKEALEPMLRGLDAEREAESWFNASIVAVNLSELSLSLGNFVEARFYGQKALDLAKRVPEVAESRKRRIAGLANFADVLHQAGDDAGAEAHFREAEALQAEATPEFPQLQRLPGYAYADFLLSQGQHAEVIERGTKLLAAASIALDAARAHLVLGRAHLLHSNEGRPRYDLAWRHVTNALQQLRQIGTLNFVPHALLALSELHLSRGNQVDLDAAESKLCDVLVLAQDMRAPLVEVDAQLALARLKALCGADAEARVFLSQADSRVQEMGYGRRRRDLEELTQKLQRGLVE